MTPGRGKHILPRNGKSSRERVDMVVSCDMLREIAHIQLACRAISEVLCDCTTARGPCLHAAFTVAVRVVGCNQVSHCIFVQRETAQPVCAVRQCIIMRNCQVSDVRTRIIFTGIITTKLQIQWLGGTCTNFV